MKKLNDREAADKIISQCPACGEEWSGGSGYDAYLAGRSAPSVIAMRDALADVIRNSSDIVAKKRCSIALAAYDREVGEK